VDTYPKCPLLQNDFLTARCPDGHNRTLTYHLYPGDHSFAYFMSHFAEVMEFHSRAFGLEMQSH